MSDLPWPFLALAVMSLISALGFVVLAVLDEKAKREIEKWGRP